MSVPPDRMAPRTGATMGKDPNKIMGLNKWLFFAIIIAGVILAYYIYKRSQSNSSSLTSAAAGTTVDDGTTDTSGLTAADIGGTPADNSFATQTDETALEEQIQQMQNTLSQLESTNGGNGAGVGSNPGGSPVAPPVPIVVPPNPGNPGRVSTGVNTGGTPSPVTGSGGIGAPVWINETSGGAGPAYPASGGIPLPPHLAGAIHVPGGRLTQ